MLASLLITFREILEISLVVGIVLGYLAKTKQDHFNNVVYLGVGVGGVLSLILALVFKMFLGGFVGRTEQIFEGVTLLVGALLLISMIVWMKRQQSVAQAIEGEVTKRLEEKERAGLFLLTTTLVLREGVETVIFLMATRLAVNGDLVTGFFLGAVAALTVGYALFVGAKKVPIKKLFNVTSILLIFFAAGLVSRGAHEFVEAGTIPPIIETVWQIAPASPNQGTPWWREDGFVGSVLHELLGYTSAPSLVEVLGWSLSVAGGLWLWGRPQRKIESVASSVT